MALEIDVEDKLVYPGYVEIPRDTDVTVADMIELLKQFDPTLPICGNNFSHHMCCLHMLAIEKGYKYDDDGNETERKVLYLAF